jgi:hypothetical protein
MTEPGANRAGHAAPGPRCWSQREPRVQRATPAGPKPLTSRSNRELDEALNQAPPERRSKRAFLTLALERYLQASS